MIATMVFLQFFLFLAILLQKPETSESDELDKILLESIIPSIGSKCELSAPPNSPGQSSTYTFDHTPSESFWHPFAAPMEPNLFQAEMSHINEANPNRSWKIRVGSGGNIYSFRGIYGEAMPPQYHPDGEFVDEVTQSVAVNLPLNANKDYFMHQAGTYYKDNSFTSREYPFFSPSIAKHCESGQCLFGSWGQQAHLPTKWESNLLYFNGYRDCGNGVMELTSVFHNSGDADDDYINYLNVPWGGVRYSSLSDIFESSINSVTGETELNIHFPIKRWGTDNSNQITNHRNSGGFTVFSQRSIIPDEIWDRTPFEPPADFTSTIAQNDGARYETAKSNDFGEYCMRVPVNANRIEPAFHGGKPFLKFVHHSGAKVRVTVMNHWNWSGNMYFCTDGFTVTQFNALYRQGDEIIAEYEDNTGGTHEDEMLALTSVHGTKNVYGKRYRLGSGGIKPRDYNVFTSNTQTAIDVGETYVNQQYMITGEFNQMISLGKDWKDEIHDDIIDRSEYSPKQIYLYSVDDQSFGVAIEDQEPCAKGIQRCSGYAAPQPDHRPLFFMACGDEKYLGVNKYHFSPSRASTSDTIRSYVCNNDQTLGGVRPTWKLMGYFRSGECDFLQNAEYDESLCTAPTPPEELWALGNAAISQINDFKITIEQSIGPSAESVQNVYLYENNCETQLDSTAAITTDSSSNVVTGTSFSYELELHADRVEDSPLVNFDLSNPLIDKSIGSIEMCAVVERVRPANTLIPNDIVVVSKPTRFKFDFNLTDDIGMSVSIEDEDIDSILSGTFEYSVNACFCTGDSYDCSSSNNLVVQQNGVFHLCLTPSSEDVVLNNLQVILSATESTSSYIPIDFGENGYVEDQLTSIMTGYQTGKTYTTLRARIRMVSMFFEDGAEQVLISGSALLDIKEGRAMSTDTTISSFSFIIKLMKEEVEEVEDVENSNLFSDVFDLLLHIVTSLLPCLL